MSKNVPSGPSGRHAATRRKLSAPDEVWALWDAAARASGVSFVKWAQRRLTVAAASELRIDTAAALETLED